MKIKTLPLVLVCLLFGSFRAMAWNYGGQITYSDQGNGLYYFYLDIFMQCQDSSHDDTLFINRPYKSRIPLTNRVKILDKDVSVAGGGCSDSSVCKGGNYLYSIRRVRYRYSFDFSSDTSCEMGVYWLNRYRSPYITTGWSNSPQVIAATFNICIVGNSSPEFLGEPEPILAHGIANILDFAAEDAENDSVSYRLVTPITTYTVIPILPFPATAPLTFFGYPNPNLPFPVGFHLDKYYGLVGFMPTKVNEVAVIAVEVIEWRKINGVITKIGSVIRELTTTTVAYSAGYKPGYGGYVPTLQMNSQKNNLCVGDTFRAVITALDSDSLERTSIQMRDVPNGMQVNVVDTGKHAYAELTWVVDSTVTPGIHQLKVLASDNNCITRRKTSQTYNLWVYARPQAEAVLDDSLCGILNTSLTDIVSVYYSNWQFIDSLGTDTLLTKGYDRLRLLPGTWYGRLSLSNPGCTEYLNDTVRIADYGYPSLNQTDTALCEDLEWKITDGGHTGSGLTYTWTDRQGTFTDNTGSYDHLALQSDTVFLRTEDWQGCVLYDSAFITVFRKPFNELGTDTANCQTTLLEIGFAPDTGIVYLWNTGSGNSLLPVSSGGVYTLTATSSQGCMRTDSIHVTLDSLVAIDLGGDRTLCHGDSIFWRFTGQYDYFLWEDGSTASWREWNQEDTIWVRAENASGCYVADTAVIGTYTLFQPINLPTDTFVCAPDSLLLQVPGYAKYQWSNGDTTNAQWFKQDRSYELVTWDTNGCRYSHFGQFYSYQPHVAITGATQACEPAMERITGSSGFASYQWSTGAGTPYLDIDSTGLYILWVTDDYGCMGSDSFEFIELPSPDAGFTWQKTGQMDLLFTANGGASVYFWNFGDGTNGSGISVNHTYAIDGNYTVQLGVSNDQGCTDSSSQVISINTAIHPLTEKGPEVYPNPNKGNLHINWPGSEQVRIRVMDQAGKEVAVIRVNPGDHAYSLDLSPGLYVLMDENGLFKPLRMEILK